MPRRFEHAEQIHRPRPRAPRNVAEPWLQLEVVEGHGMGKTCLG